MAYKHKYVDVIVTLRLPEHEIDGMLDADKFGDIMSEEEIRTMLVDNPERLLYDADWEFVWGRQ